MRLIHVITGLATGGAEIMMLRTIEGLTRNGIDCHVASVTGLGPVAAQLASLGVPVVDLGTKSPVLAGRAVRRLKSAIKAIAPDLIHAWMYHANVIAHIANLGKGAPPTITSVHHSLDDESDASFSRRFARVIDMRLSSRGAGVIFASLRAMEQHIERGYARANAVFLPNGFDVQRFAPNPELRRSQRQLLGIAETDFVVGCVARLDPVKNHGSLLQAAEVFSRVSPRAKFVLVGRGVAQNNRQFLDEVQRHNLQDRCFLLGERRDLPALFAAMDVACLSSKSEGFPLTLGEAMACGLSCVATNVGDCAMLVGDTGVIVPPEDHNALADAWRSLERLGLEGRAALGLRARSRIVDHFSMGAYISKLEDLYATALGSGNRLA